MDILLKTYRDSVAIKLPDEEEWKRMHLYEKRSVEERLQMLIKDMKNIGSIYNVNLLQLLPRHLMAEYDSKFVNIGAKYTLWKDHINIIGELRDCKYPSVGVFFKVHLK